MKLVKYSVPNYDREDRETRERETRYQSRINRYPSGEEHTGKQAKELCTLLFASNQLTKKVKSVIIGKVNE